MKLIGLDKCIHKLDDIGKKAAKSLVRKAARQGLKPALNRARSEAPARSGVTRKQIKIRGGKSRTGAVALKVSWKGTPEAFYGIFVIEGHRIGSRRLGDARTLVPANDFMTRAYEATKTDIVNTTAANLKDLIETEARS